jgi:DNA-binding transcriptional regulator LsrR (DeoR family)
LTASKRKPTSRKIRRCPHQARQMQVVRTLQGQWGLTVKQLARRLKVSERSIRRYLPVLLDHGIVVVNFTYPVDKAKKYANHYALKRKK